MRKYAFCLSVVLVATLLFSLIAPTVAHAWGPRSMRSITAMALQVIKHDFPNVFRPSGIVGPNFERDVLAGASEGWQVIAARKPLNNDAEVIQAIAAEILLLREVRQYGPTPYFAFRMGALGSLTAHAMLPYGFVWSTDDMALRRSIISDIEADIDNFSFSVAQRNREFIRNAADYFERRRSFHAEDKRLIAHDYRTGVGYDGMMRQAGRAYFVRAVEAVADVWNTILRAEINTAEFGLSRPSQRTLTWYFLDEMEYLLRVRDNMHQVEKVYENFATVNPGMPEAYEQLGDIFYDHEKESVRLRGVEEWKKAYNLGGPDRARIGRKISDHFMDTGRHHLDRAARPGAEETDLNNALYAFERALDFDRMSEEAAEMIQDTNVAIRQRNERLEVTLNIIATGERIAEEAARYRDNRDFANAISTYRQAVGFFEAVDDEFREQANTARDQIRRLRREISDVINEVLDAASQVIDEGDRARERRQYEEAISHYQRVPGVVAVIPDDESPTVVRDRDELVDLADRKVEETTVEQLRFEEAQQEQAEAQAQQ